MRPGLFFFGLLLLLAGSCGKEATSKSEVDDAVETQTEASKPEAKERLEKPADSVNNKNTVAFLEKYGAENPETRLVIKTRLGDIGLRLYEDTPLHRASFVFLAKVGYFDTTCFYRVVPDFIIQGGESERLDTQRYKARYMRYKIPPEFRNSRVRALIVDLVPGSRVARDPVSSEIVVGVGRRSAFSCASIGSTTSPSKECVIHPCSAGVIAVAGIRSDLTKVSDRSQDLTDG